MSIREDLFNMRDDEYKLFHARLVPALDAERIIGVRVPRLRDYAAKIAGCTEAQRFLEELPHRYYEENNLHAFLVEKICDFDLAVRETERFLPYIDNWATCDSFLPKVFAKNTEKLLPFIKKWLKSDKTYTVRYAIGLLMKLYLKENFSAEYPRLVAEIKTDEYYVNMMIAWYFATASAVRFEETVEYIKSGRLGAWITNKAIQKSIESRRVSETIKDELRKCRIK